MVKDGLEMAGRKVGAESFRYRLRMSAGIEKIQIGHSQVPRVPVDRLSCTLPLLTLCKLPNSSTHENNTY
jgi:hypothetical protein